MTIRAAAALLREIGAPLELVDIEVDDPAPHEVLVRVKASGLCHSDLHFIDGTYRHALPTVLGHEAAGIVEAVGSEVDYVTVGDHVVSSLAPFCGSCDFCLSGRPNLCEAKGLTRPADVSPRLSLGGQPLAQYLNLSAFSEAMLVHEHALVRIDKSVPIGRAGLLGCAVVTGVGAVLNTAKVKVGDAVAVIGCGGVGLNCIQGAGLAGASVIIAVDQVERKLDLARRFGATDVVNASDGDVIDSVRRISRGGVDHAFEAIGLTETAEQSIAMLRRGGTSTLIGMIKPGVTIGVPSRVILNEMKVQGSFFGSTRFRIDVPHYLDLYLQGRLMLDELVSEEISLAEVNEGFAAMRAGEVARAIIRL
jgi:S-(hydroxymethyl)glutathione dehydrogenase/alcohol dehydrogenase